MSLTLCLSESFCLLSAFFCQKRSQSGCCGKVSNSGFALCRVAQVLINTGSLLHSITRCPYSLGSITSYTGAFFMFSCTHQGRDADGVRNRLRRVHLEEPVHRASETSSQTRKL